MEQMKNQVRMEPGKEKNNYFLLSDLKLFGIRIYLKKYI
jgi:hypothetical protein